MTDRATLESLLARVLEGEGPDRALDAEITRMLLPPDADAVTRSRHGWSYRVFGPDGWDDEWLENKPYTVSLDAALTLVPEDRDWHVQSNRSVGACWASISPAKHDLKLREWGSGMMKAVTPERALIAACLKARMEAQGV